MRCVPSIRSFCFLCFASFYGWIFTSSTSNSLCNKRIKTRNGEKKIGRRILIFHSCLLTNTMLIYSTFIENIQLMVENKPNKGIMLVQYRTELLQPKCNLWVKSLPAQPVIVPDSFFLLFLSSIYLWMSVHANCFLSSCVFSYPPAHFGCHCLLIFS